MSQQSINAFTHAYQISKMLWCVDDNHWKELFNSPKNPTSRKDERKVKFCRMQTREEQKEIQKLKNKYNL